MTNRIFASMVVSAVALVLTGCTAEITLSVPDMMCEESCAVKVREVLAKQEGVQSVKVDFPSRTATLSVSRSRFDIDRAIAALVDHQFEPVLIQTASRDSRSVRQVSVQSDANSRQD